MKKQKRNVSWTPFTKHLEKENRIVDNELEKSIKELDLFAKAHLYGLVKLKGFHLQQTLFSVIIWPMLMVSSLHFFCGNRLKGYFNGGKDVLYSFLKRQNINWRGYRFHIAKQLYRRHELGKESIRAAVFDDTIKHRRGKNVAATSSHFDHTLKKHVMGQQVLEMGLATSKGYLPIDSQIYISNSKVQYGKDQIKDYRSHVGKDFLSALNCDKNQMLKQMLKRVCKCIRFTHILGDSWFGNKDNIKAALVLGLTAIFRMKRGNLQYRYGKHDYTATELYAWVKRRMKRLKGTPYNTVSINVFLNLTSDKKNPVWQPVTLLFSSSVRQRKENWVIFLSTDTTLSAAEILEIYALRWGIEVYFKEVKQHFGFLKEQTGDYVVHYASVHLCAIRFILVAHRMMASDASFGEIRNKITQQMELLTFARLLWELFKAIIWGALDQLKETLSATTIELVKDAISCSISEFLDKALQLDDDFIEGELKAEAIGAL